MFGKKKCPRCYGKGIYDVNKSQVMDHGLATYDVVNRETRLRVVKHEGGIYRKIADTPTGCTATLIRKKDGKKVTDKEKVNVVELPTGGINQQRMQQLDDYFTQSHGQLRHTGTLRGLGL